METQHYLAGNLYACKKTNIITQLQKDILPLQGLKALSTDPIITIDFPPIETSFPNATFPIGCVHEFLSTSTENAAATNGFVAGLLSRLMQLGGVCIWISSARTLFPPALKTFGIEPDQIIFIDLKKEKDVLWTMEEALKCNRLTAVLGELKEISFTESRKLQLAVEQSRVTGFILRHKPRSLNTIACVSRWRITSLPSESEDGMPGVGFPRWNVELLKVRNGKPGNWKVEWLSNRFQNITENIFSIPQEKRRKTG
jgi:protein ImuA